jgi:hypothetical protein
MPADYEYVATPVLKLGAGGASSWNDLTDKPFYETVVGGDTLTWDGNTEGLTSVNFYSDSAYKVSDAVFSTEDCVNGVNSSLKLPDRVIQEECVIFNNGGVSFAQCAGFPAVFSVPPECVGVDINDITFPEAGTYLMKTPYYHCSSLSIPGFGGFPSIKPIDTKFLPEPLQFGETEVMGDTLTWDGNTEGLMRVEDEGGFLVLYKVSNATPSIEDFASGASYDATGPDGNPDTTELTANDIESLIDGIILVDMVIVVHENAANVELEDMGGLSFPEPGTYFASSADGSYTSSLTIPGYTGFVTKTVKPIEEKYIPGDLIPAYTAEDEGKVLKIVGGVPTWVTP